MTRRNGCIPLRFGDAYKYKGPAAVCPHSSIILDKAGRGQARAGGGGGGAKPTHARSTFDVTFCSNLNCRLNRRDTIHAMSDAAAAAKPGRTSLDATSATTLKTISLSRGQPARHGPQITQSSPHTSGQKCAVRLAAFTTSLTSSSSSSLPLASSAPRLRIFIHVVQRKPCARGAGERGWRGKVLARCPVSLQ